MKKHTVDVLDAAAALERKMRWLDFKNEQERLLQYDPDAEWNVGDYRFDGPTHRSHAGIFATEYGVSEFHNYASIPGERYGRPTYVNTLGLRFCEDCEVYTAWREFKCWFCETTYERPKLTNPAAAAWAEYSLGDVAAVRALFTEAAETITERYREMIPVLQNFGDQIQVYMTVSFDNMRLVLSEADSIGSFYPGGWTDVEPYEPETNTNAWYMANLIDAVQLVENRMPDPVPFVSRVRTRWVGTQIEWPEDVSLEPEIPLPDAPFPEFVAPEHLQFPTSEVLTERRNR